MDEIEIHQARSFIVTIYSYRDPECNEVCAEYCVALAGKGLDRGKIEKSLSKLLDEATTRDVLDW